ncbi:hypothetical protein H6F56_23565 [Microcoleus sp. FACHB-672]|nr:hypothetical protein [Microcoleus sp. FACHB-672]
MTGIAKGCALVLGGRPQHNQREFPARYYKGGKGESDQEFGILHIE